MSLGKSIEIYLMDGTATGIWQAKLSNWNAVAYKIPRQELKKCNDLDFDTKREFNSPGVYFLFGKDEKTGKTFIYVGEADDTLKRLQQIHSFENDETYWTEAVIFVTPDRSLEKGRVKYLENRFYSIAVDTGRYVVKNANIPTLSPVPQRIKDALENFIINAKLVLPTLGYKAFEALETADNNDNDLLFLKRNQFKAKGKINSDGFWVLKGSQICSCVAEYVNPGIKKLRETYADKIDENGILNEDLCFASPSAASTFVIGKNSNGLVEWKNKDDLSLKELDIRVGGEPAVGVSSQTKIYQLSSSKAKASGYSDGSGFTVKKGSEFCNEVVPSCQNWIIKIREQLITEGKIKNGIFTENVYFDSMTAAASCIVGGSVNGKKLWK